MEKLTTIVVDDEPLALQLLAATVSENPAIELVAQCKNGREAIEAVLQHNPDLMFLDIRMPGMSGFDVIQNVQPELLPMVVFCTAYEQFAVEAFDVHAVDYVLKPFDEERIERAVRRALDRREGEEQSVSEKAQLLGAIDSIASKVSADVTTLVPDEADSPSSVAEERKIAIKDGDSYSVFKESDIDWVDAAGDYMCVHVQGVTHILRSTMKHLLEELDGTVFKRVHRSTVVNLNRIEQVTPHTKGDYFLRLCNDEKIKVSRNYRDAIKDFLSERQID